MRLGRIVIINDEAGSWLERWDLIAQNFDAIGIWPVMKDGAEEIDVRLPYRLFFENIIGYERDALFQLLRQPLSTLLHNIRKVFNDTGEPGKALSEADRHSSVTATNIDNICLAQRLPIKAIENWVHGDSRCCSVHGIRKSFRALGMFLKLLIESYIGTIGKRKTLQRINSGYGGLSGSYLLSELDHEPSRTWSMHQSSTLRLVFQVP